LLGLLSILFAEIFSGVSQLWFIKVFGVLYTLPLFMMHTIFFLSLAIKYKKTSIKQLYLNLEGMGKAVIRKNGNIYLCGTCMDARGISEENIIEGTLKSTMAQLAELTEKADMVLVLYLVIFIFYFVMKSIYEINKYKEKKLKKAIRSAELAH
jgi:peroxiredoxin family protein